MWKLIARLVNNLLLWGFNVYKINDLSSIFLYQTDEDFSPGVSLSKIVSFGGSGGINGNLLKQGMQPYKAGMHFHSYISASVSCSVSRSIDFFDFTFTGALLTEVM